ncbi:MAG TPA: cytochrome c biogenesis protein CcsA [Gammaproteobacteria bacterium]|jgi:ABC-type uncharacterized transport system permease subunit|nr:cytochrome c biogenesis protein CcsA [Gammaproteobacteria bacterium]
MNPILPGLLSILCYLLASGLLVSRLSRGNSNEQCVPDPAILIALAAITAHGILLYPAIITPAGLNLGFVYAASLVALTSAFLLAASTFFQPVGNLGIVVFPVAAVSIGLLLGWPGQRLVTNSSWQLETHILSSLLAYSILALAVFQSILLSIQDRHLRNRQPGGFIRALPPLAVMESLLFQMIATGFALLSLALVTGFLFLEDIFAQHLVHKTTLSIIAWFVFAILLWGRWRFGWRGQTALRWTIGGFIFLMLAYFGSKFVLELVLNG